MLSLLIIVPTLNSYKELPKLVLSLEEQTFKNWRVLFVDGQSSLAHQEWLTSQCSKDSRFEWKQANVGSRGIFGAMNDGLKDARDNEWILFWGSDDLVASREAFSSVASSLSRLGRDNDPPDLYICTGQYYSLPYGRLQDEILNLKRGRISKFIWRNTYQRSLFWGSTPPHQATLFGPKVWNKIDKYDATFQITADLDFFLRLSQNADVKVWIDDIVLVLMGDEGVSGRENKQRMTEVIRSYRNRFGIRWLLPFVMRYYQRIRSLMES